MSAAETHAGSPRPIPRSGWIPFLRDLLQPGRERRDMLSLLRESRELYGDVVIRGVGPLKMVHLFGPEANRVVLQDRERIFSARRPWNLIMGRIFPNGLLLRDGEDHKFHRKIMHQAFKRPALRDYLGRMGPVIEERIETWDDTRDVIQAFPRLKELTLELAARVFVGVDLGPETTRMNRAFEDMVAASMSRLRLPIPGLEFQRGLQGREELKTFFGDLVPKKREGDGTDMFTRLCHAETEEGERFSDREVIDHMIFLMMAAHDTTTSTLSSMAYELARHPDWQERVREESRALGKDELAWDDLEKLPALGRVMRETLRLYPPLPVIPRITARAFDFGDFRVPADTMVVVAPILTHRLPEWWSEPERFDPERFAPERAEHEQHSHLWVPFGGGPHHCLGFRFAEVQVKSIMHALLRRFRWHVAEGYRMPVQQAPISKPRDGLPLTIERVD